MEVGKELAKENTKLQPHTYVTNYFVKMKGERLREPNVNLTDSIISTTGGVIAISVISIMVVILGYPMILGPMGASCLLVFAAHGATFSQPRHIIGGHTISSLTALAIWDFFGRTYITIGITLALVLFLMLILKIVHPPAAASAIVAINTQAGWGYMIPIIICSLLLIMISLFYNNLFKDRQYPKQWI